MRANWLRKTGLSCLLIMLVVTAGALVAQADVIPVDPLLWSGPSAERAKDDNALIANNNWGNPPAGNGFEIYWNISQTGPTFHYQYTITGQEDPNNPSQHLALSANLLLLFIQTSPTATAADFINVEFNGSPHAFTVGTQGNFGYGMELTGLFGKGPDMVFSFDTTKEPVWGNFLAGDGIGSGTFAANLGFFGAGPTPANAPEFIKFIPTPDTGVVPLPASVLLLGSGLVGLAGWRFKLRKS
jgi:hypothetical protein